MSSWNDPELRELFLGNTPLIDVRAPSEFLTGSIPHSINLPILTNEERVLVGTCYKERGQEAAIVLGHHLVGGTVKSARVDQWEKSLIQNPSSQIFCFRGGLRSQITCQWLSERGILKTPINGGYKRLRQFFLSYIEEGPMPQFIRLAGVTGSGKTRLLPQIQDSVDLEKIAHHRGSAFGSMGEQPSQVTFENQLALEFMKLENRIILVEDESQMIGKRQIPNRYFNEMRNASIILLKVTQEEQCRNIFDDYVRGSEKIFFLEGMEKIRSRLSHELMEKIISGISHAFDQGFEFLAHEEWITLLLKHYYNPLYLKDIKRNHHKIIFEGTAPEIFQYLSQIVKNPNERDQA